MSTIFVSDLSPAGLDLFSGSECYINELSDDDLVQIKGATGTPCFSASLVLFGGSAVVSGIVSGIVGYTGRKK
jgi:hypothetical protein